MSRGLLHACQYTCGYTRTVLNTSLQTAQHPLPMEKII